MKYMLLITQGEWFVKSTEAERARAMEKVEEWWGKQLASGRMIGGQQLQSPDTATTVVIERGRYTLVDRPLLEAKEAIGGFGILETSDLCRLPSRALPLPWAPSPKPGRPYQARLAASLNRVYPGC